MLFVFSSLCNQPSLHLPFNYQNILTNHTMLSIFLCQYFNCIKLYFTCYNILQISFLIFLLNNGEGIRSYEARSAEKVKIVLFQLIRSYCRFKRIKMTF